MFLNIGDNIINTNNITILRKEVHINTNSSISEVEYCISINGVRIKFSTEQERDKFFDDLWQEIEKIKR